MRMQITKWFCARQDSGSAAVEMAIICPILIALIAAVLDFGAMFYEQTAVVTAADAGALYAVAYGYNPSNPTNIENAVQNSTSTISVTAPAPTQFCGCPTTSPYSIHNLGPLTGSPPSCSAFGNCANGPDSGLAAGTYLTVNAQHQYKPMIPWTILPWSHVMGSAQISLSAGSTVRIQ
jgi:Flp pilus assembly protein TadG